MDSADQRRKRKRILRQSSLNLLSVRFFLTCLIFLIFLHILPYTRPSTSAAFRPVLVASRSLLSSSRVKESGNLLLPVRIEGRVLFPDHVLLLVSGGNVNNELECVYFGNLGNLGNDFGKKKVLSVDEYDGFRSIVRCPLPSMNYSDVVHLGKNGILGGKIRVWVGNQRVKLWGNEDVDKNGILGEKTRVWVGNQSVESWENVAYAAAVDGETAVVFVKGLNLRSDRESDPSLFRCHFGLGKWERNGRFTLSTRALTAAQEVVRCPLPKSIRNNLDRGIRVTVGLVPRVHARSRKHVLMPSVAKIFDSRPGGETRGEGEVKGKGKYELCVCTMVWNQASAIREWIKYHSWLGVERWFIYDNNSDDGIGDVIQELERDNYNVSRHAWPWIKTQEAGFSHCALRAKDECSWVSFMDVDEYFYFPYTTPGHQSFGPSGYASQNALRALVANFSSSSVAEIRTSCHSFGPSGLKSRPSRGVTVGYTCRLQNPERHKSIIRPDALDPTLLNVVHHFHLRKEFEYVNLPQSAAVINHYKYQVWEVFRAKFYRRVATYVADWQENQNEGSRDRAPGLGTEAIEPPDWSQRFCEVWDTGLSDFVLANLADVSSGLLPWEMTD